MSLKTNPKFRSSGHSGVALRLVGLALILAALGACSTRYEVVPVASIGPRPEPPTELMSAAEKNEAIAELQAEAARNNTLGF